MTARRSVVLTAAGTVTTTVLLTLGGIVLGALVAPAQAAVAPRSEPRSASAVQVMVGANRTTGVRASAPRAVPTDLATDFSVGTDLIPVSTGKDARHLGTAASKHRSQPAATAKVEQGTTADDLTAGGHPAWWWGAWLLLAVPAGSALAWWIGRGRERHGPSTGPLYS